MTFVTFVTSNALYCQKDWRIFVCRVSFLETLTTSPTFSQLFSNFEYEVNAGNGDKHFLIASLNGFKSTAIMPNPPYCARQLQCKIRLPLIPNLIHQMCHIFLSFCTEGLRGVARSTGKNKSAYLIDRQNG